MIAASQQGFAYLGIMEHEIVWVCNSDLQIDLAQPGSKISMATVERYERDSRSWFSCSGSSTSCTA